MNIEPFRFSHKNVVIGEDDVLFLYNGGRDLHLCHNGVKEPSQESISSILTNQHSRYEYCTSNNINYRHAIFPNKQTSLQGYYPVDICSVIDKCLDLDSYGDSIIDLRPPLAPRGHSVWLKTDTHLNREGEILCSIEIANSLLQTNLDSHTSNLMRLPFTRTRKGDLAVMLGDDGADIHEQEVLCGTHWIQHHFSNKLPGGNNGLIDIFINQNAIENKRLLIFGDSFGRASASCLSYFFSYVMFCRTPFLHYEIAEMYHPDFILTQTIERYLPSTKTDDSRPVFFFFPIIGKYGQSFEGDKMFFQALNAELTYPRSGCHSFFETLSVA